MKPRHIPIRTCVVCRQTSEKKSLLRVVRRTDADGGVTVALDATGKANGRGAYVCATEECIEKAIKQKRFERSLHVNSLSEALGEQLRASIEPTLLLGATVNDHVTDVVIATQ